MARGLNKTASTPAAARTPNTARCSNAAADLAKPAVFGGDVLADIDWSQPWFVPWRELGEPVARQALQQQSVAKALNALHERATQQTSIQRSAPASTRAGLALGCRVVRSECTALNRYLLRRSFM